MCTCGKPVPLIACALLFVGVYSDTISNSTIDLSLGFQSEGENIKANEWFMLTKNSAKPMTKNTLIILLNGSISEGFASSI